MTLLHEMFDATAAQVPQRLALRHQGRGISYAQLGRRSTGLAGALQRRGVARGDRVAVYLQNRPEVVEVALACSRIGAIFVPVNPMLRSRQLGHVLRDCGAKILVASSTAALSTAELAGISSNMQALVLCGGDHNASAALPCWSYESLADAPSPPQAAPVLEDDPVALLYTSGSTGKPKGVIVTHRNLVSGARSVARYLGNVADDRILAVLPLSFDYGLSQVTTTWTVGACAVLSTFSLPAALLQELAAECITGLAGVPTMWMHLAAAEWTAAAPGLRYVTSSGGALPTAVIQNLQQRLPATRIFCMYGLTEAFRSTYLDPEQLSSRLGSIGKAIPGQEVLVVRADGTPCAPGETGEIVHRGSFVTLGYWNDPELTRRRFRSLPRSLTQIPREDIAVWSGDLATVDADGYLYFAGRQDHLIKSSGHRISPTEIEEVVLEVPGVIEAAALGVADEILGQRIVVAVVAEPNAGAGLLDAIRYRCRVQLPAHMAPSEIRFLDSLPRNPNGKCDRSTLSVLLQNDARDSEERATARAAG